MSTIERSFIGWLIARLIAFVRVLPSVRARDVPFEFNLTATPDGGWIKERLYHFRAGLFEFRSVMRIEATGGENSRFLNSLVRRSVDAINAFTTQLTFPREQQHEKGDGQIQQGEEKQAPRRGPFAVA